MTVPEPSTERILGWDLLRGLCAIAVACYHLLLWQDVAALHSFGSYGVYLFFVLSGASLAYTYGARVVAHDFSFGGFLWTRYLRLAPLYLALMVLMLPWKLAKEGATSQLFAIYLTNASFTFGFYQPATHAALVGGWSLGIEAVFYLLFPLLVRACYRPRLAMCLMAVLLALQVAWIAGTVGGISGYTANAVAYHHAPAFAAYFMGGCMLGAAYRMGHLPQRIPDNLALPGILAGFAVLLWLNPAQQGDELLGWRGLVSAPLLLALVYLAGQLKLQGRMAAAARCLGEATYGIYLIHPIVFFGLVWVLLPRLGLPSPLQLPLTARVGVTVAVLLLAGGAALLSERFFERPLRQRLRWGRGAQQQKTGQ